MAGVSFPFHVLRLAWFELPAAAKGGSTQTFLSACPDMEQKEEGMMWLQTVSSQKPKMESDSLLQTHRLVRVIKC